MIPERRYSVVVVAGGQGLRAGGTLPKQFQRIGEKPMLMHTLRAFHVYDYRMRIILVIPEGYRPLWETLCDECRFTVPHVVVHGGETRFHSVRNGLREISDEETVGIHDGARPFVTPSLIGCCFDTSFEQGVGVIPVVDEVNTVRVLTETGSRMVDRTRLKIVQTPQVFPAAMVKRAYEQEYDPTFTDDASVVERSGMTVRLVEGEETNVKITTSFDLAVAEYRLAALRNQ
ncbi:MAG: 2-C-methyl-D-erythritol 4-phosphate cytidylyltransferase [Bacteroidota bacterium]|nr:2-C-methyl-D-erythritol 4-phosphate cytidylyltransferase [Bacteroidota bacterium]HHU97396.1 2-C-methyl-D-erythritol 4-phosphate cytidylyltransferase [Petrimonas sp.]